MEWNRVLKKVICVTALDLCIVSGFTACGDISGNEGNFENKDTKVENEENLKQELEMEEKEGQKVEQETKSEIEPETEQELELEMKMKQEARSEMQPKIEQEEQENEIVSYKYKNIFMSMKLPLEWDYKIHTAKELGKQDGLKVCSIEFWLKEKPEVKLDFAYWSMIGLCGTGVTIEKVAFANGLSATKYTEDDWFMIIYELENRNSEVDANTEKNVGEKLEDGKFAIDGIIEKKLWEEYEEDIIKVLDTISFTEQEEK